mgnify:CR=1 FL=1
MRFYKPRKKYLCSNIICVACVIVIISYLCIKFAPSPVVKFIPPILTLGIGIWSIFLLTKDYRNGLTISSEKIRVTSRGSTFDINYHDIFSIHYSGIPNCAIWDCLVLDCRNKRTIYIDAAAYYEYAFIWKKIIKYAKAAKPNIVIDPQVQKRLEQYSHRKTRIKRRSWLHVQLDRRHIRAWQRSDVSLKRARRRMRSYQRRR